MGHWIIMTARFEMDDMSTLEKMQSGLMSKQQPAVLIVNSQISMAVKFTQGAGIIHNTPNVFNTQSVKFLPPNAD